MKRDTSLGSWVGTRLSVMPRRSVAGIAGMRTESQEIVVQPEDLPGDGQQLLPGGRQPQRPAGPGEDRAGDTLFEPKDFLADRRLRPPHDPRGGGEAAAFGNGDECPQQVDLDIGHG